LIGERFGVTKWSVLRVGTLQDGGQLITELLMTGEWLGVTQGSVWSNGIVSKDGLSGRRKGWKEVLLNFIEIKQKH
jgi:hypothetical protein